MPVAFPVSRSSDIVSDESILYHVSSPTHRDSIVTSTEPTGLPSYANCTIHLKAGQGWSVAPFRLLRDYSILDPHLTHIKDWGCYTYFFIGEPGWWGVKKNIGITMSWDNLRENSVIYQIRGSDMLACSALLFYRPDDNVLVIRGDYTGPAFVIG